MPAPWLESLGILDPSPLGLGAEPLRLRRATPVGPDHAILEYDQTGGRGGVTAAQWMRARDNLVRLADRTRAACGAPVGVLDVGGTAVLVQAGGADRVLVRLARLVERPGALLISHRSERRAVVRLGEGPGARYAKMYRRGRLAEAIGRHRAVESGARRDFNVAPVLEVDEEDGLVLFGGLVGRPLYDRWDDPNLPAWMRMAGAALRALHELAPPEGMQPHTGADEVEVVRSWASRIAPFAPETARVVLGRLTAVAPPAPAGAGLIHRDFYDKQVLIDSDRVGILDFDLLATGDPALDIANFLAHVDLRAAQGRVPPAQAREAAAAFLSAYAPDAERSERLAPYRELARLRLACVYAVRPAGATLAPALLDSPPAR